MESFSFKKMHLKVSPLKWWPFCLGLNVSSYVILLSLDSFTVSLHSANGMHARRPSVAFEKLVEIPTDHLNPQSIAIEAIPTYILTSQSQKGDTS